MRSVRLTFFLLVIIALPLPAQQVEVIEHELENGIQILMVQRPGDPSVAAGWVAHVGSVNERPGITGMAHLFEHMMFKGTRTIGTKDYAADRRIMEKKDSLRTLMREEESEMRAMQRRGLIDDIRDPDNWTDRYKELESEIRALIEEQREIIVKDELDRIYSNAGATSLNAGTSNDFTIYFINVPTNKIELFFWLESDRLYNPVFREFYAERDVVREERRLRIESTPTGKFEETFESMFFTSHPYGWPVIGWPSDVESITREQANDFYDMYYGANNLTFIFVGDIDPDTIIGLSEKYLARLPRSPRPIPEVITEELEPVAEKRMIAYAETNPTVRIRYHTVPFNHKDAYALDVLAGVLSGRTGRLYRDLVLEQDIATEVSAFQNGRKFAGYFQLNGVAKGDYTPEDVEREIYKHIEELRTEPVTERELQRVKNQNVANSYRRLGSNFFLMFQLGIFEVMDTWEYINEQPGRIQEVTAEDIMHVVNTYFGDDKRTVAIYYTKDAGTPEEPAIAALPQELQAQAKQVQGQIRQIDSVEQLEMMLAQSRSAEGRVEDEGQRKMIQFVIGLIEDRIQELTQD
jgi:predicted Zn-dependent peptidase